MAKDPTSPIGPGQAPRTGQAGHGEGSYFEGEGRDPFADRAVDRDSKEAEAAVDDLMDGLLGTHTVPKPGGGSASS